MRSPDPLDLVTTLSEWYAVHARELPWRRPGTTAWGVLVSEVMLQQTPVARVLPTYAEWMARWPTPTELADASPGDAVRAWGRLGYPRRALRLHAAAGAITADHGGAVPEDLAALLGLPGVGSYTARAVASFAFGQRHAVVDTNVRRVVSRVVGGLADRAPSPGADLRAVEPLLPETGAAASLFSAALMELGATVCTARTPQCGRCPVVAACRWRAVGYPPLEAPARRPQPWAGSDRQVRGRLMQLLREAPGPISRQTIAESWPEALQRDRALAGLVADGLADVDGDGRIGLPGLRQLRPSGQGPPAAGRA